ncbi:hypothetical protein PGT21_006937 [Puccinia graminis f. sp. tritici]|uniref:Uncharacterized protein n=2 Tax=Puccinia graminis f. sp. tritici TaxID=56615 RepID=E3JTZ6_PUCGT|nr:uncharacterized protein PGTG_00848 [Puccinia graminis f. sp. tritici CRL 75-36-700-3]EFP75517.1 hypothetical protein PGTG_00848 [Puccinia graminis f. sp. tritici CRL 75-36-700-3]KAA1116261.1 hypothetical protein PGT21_006937 [Puccinia graminis f. sp. tritici]
MKSNELALPGPASSMDPTNISCHRVPNPLSYPGEVHWTRLVTRQTRLHGPIKRVLIYAPVYRRSMFPGKAASMKRPSKAKQARIWLTNACRHSRGTLSTGLAQMG